MLALVRHSTQTPIAAFDVSSGKVEGVVGDRRTEAEFATFLDQPLATTSPLVLRDQETGTTWDEGGVALEGALAGQQLTPIVDSYVGFWFAWSLYFRNLRLYE